MKIAIDIRKSVQDNAGVYYDKAKKAKGKMAGLLAAIETTKVQLAAAQAKAAEPVPMLQPKLEKRNRDWYERFHWMFTSDGLLVIGGKDAKENETIVKKHMNPQDVYLHADIKGAASTLIVTEGKEPTEAALNEAARFAVAYSKAFARGLGVADAYWVKPDQVKTAAKPGEFLAKGAFVIDGRKNFIRNVKAELAVGFDAERGRVIIGSREAVAAKSKDVVMIEPGATPKGEFAKALAAKHGWPLDDLNQLLPSGDMKVVGAKK